MELLLLPSGKDLHSNCFIFLHPNRYSVNQKFICFCLPACLHSLFAVCFLPARACLKNALRKMCVTICGRFCSDEGVVAGYDNRIRTKSPAKWGVQIAGMIFQTRSSVFAQVRKDSEYKQTEEDNAMSNLSHLDALEAEAIYIMREVAAECEKPVMLYSIGKDSSVMLHLAMKAFYPEKPPFPFLHIDTILVL